MQNATTENLAKIKRETGKVETDHPTIKACFALYAKVKFRLLNVVFILQVLRVPPAALILDHCVTRNGDDSCSNRAPILSQMTSAPEMRMAGNEMVCSVCFANTLDPDYNSKSKERQTLT